MSGRLFPIDDPADYRRIRDVLDAAGYDDAGVSGVLGTNPSNLTGKKLPVLLHRAGGGGPLEVLVRLFVLGTAVDATAAHGALAPLPPSWWADRGLVRIDGDQVQAAVQLRCFQELVVAFDFRRRTNGLLPPDYVMGIGASSLTLAGLTVRRPGHTVLDLGTGSGFQAFLAARHSERVVATDRNPRAVEMARFNAALNGLDRVDCREGDLFEPVAGEAFDLIVSNPPFIISPENVYYFLHSGMAGDEVCRTIAGQAGAYLRPGGYCQFLANWAVVGGEDWRDRLRGWFEGTGCDAWVLRRGSQPPDEYASVWIEAEAGPDGWGEAFGAWMDYYRRLGIEAIDSGVVSMRRRGDGALPWYRADDVPETMSFPAGTDIARGFEAQDFLAATGDDALMATRFRLAPDVRLDQQYRAAGGGWEAVASRLRRVEGLQWSGAIDAYGAAVLAGCDGSRPIGQVLDDLAASLGADAPASAADAPAWAGVVRRLVERGFLLAG